MNNKWDDLKKSVQEKIAKTVREHMKHEDREFVNPWSTQDKASVLQQTRCFGDSPIDSHKCIELCTRVLYLLQQGEVFTSKELTPLFFGVTKLFQAENKRLRRMVYLIIKELDVGEGEVFICVSSLIKDMNGKNDCFRANSIRVLSRILDANMAGQIDRYLKTAVVDKNAFVASSALVCGMTLMRTAPDVVRRWVNEVQETINSKHQMVQFHALALMYELKRTDRLALHKVVISLAKSGQKGTIAECLLVRYALQTLLTERDSMVEKQLMAYLDSCLRHKSQTVTFEAARAVCQLAVADKEGSGTTVFGYDMSHATTVLQIFLTSTQPVQRFGAIKTLNMLAQARPQVAARCNCDMEPLLTDNNRTTATLALTTLLKTGNESNVERLVKQIQSFMSDISDAYKVEVVRAVKGLCLLYPSKYKTLMSFLSSNLREDGTQDFKRDLVEALILVVGQVPAAKETGLSHLCEYIEDCEFPNLCSRVLAFLGEEVPSTPQPAKFIRFIYNRLILENSVVRAAAVEALANIAMKCPGLRRDILVLLQFGENDNDDEVRDRIGLYTHVIQSCLAAPDDKGSDAQLAFSALVSTDMPFSIDALYDGMLEHISSDRKETAFSFETLPTDEAYRASQKAQAAVQSDKKPGLGGAAGAPAAGAGKSAAEQKAEAAAQQANANAELMRIVSQIVPAEQLGQLQHSCRPQYLTESEAEYTVQVIKHIFKEHVALEMYVSNTVPGITLENIEVRLTGCAPNWTDCGATAIDRLENGQQASAHVVLAKASAAEETAGALVGTFGAALKFIVKEEGDDLGYDDDYPVEKLKITIGDYMFPRAVPAGQFKSVWEQMGVQGQEAQEKMSLNFKTLQPAVDYVIKTLNMMPCDGTEKIEPDKQGHALCMSGSYCGGQMTLAKVLLGLMPNQNVVACRISVRSKNPAVGSTIVGALMG
eukprot:TRINITY_DN4215_c1_g1_i1.p1 TRINITY_DN4215_c1_g1~~TRINITY_DN4215_c1_g1_i1.p1  ORF type:complete len:938 (+),score=324.72 TRINITY_DN4215_c1_g1_i1:105-2918(+)